MEVQYDSQVRVIGAKASESKLDVSSLTVFYLEHSINCGHLILMLVSQLQEVSDYYYTRLRAAQEAFFHPRLPPIYHQFLAERETWKHYCG
jgi:hypothetical protein